MGQILGGWGFEVGRLDTSRVHKFEHTFCRAVLAACVHSLKDNHQRLPGVGVEQFLQFTDAVAQTLGFLAGLVFIQAVVKIRVEIFQPNRRQNFDRLGHKLNCFLMAMAVALSAAAFPCARRCFVRRHGQLLKWFPRQTVCPAIAIQSAASSTS